MQNKITMFFRTVFIAIAIATLNGCSFPPPDYLKIISSAQLNEILKNNDIFLVDVHIPEQRHIPGTDLFIPYNKIEKHISKFPKDKNTEVYLYCEGGPMGNAAAKTLHDLGYQNLFNLKGGARAWRAAGYQFE